MEDPGKSYYVILCCFDFFPSSSPDSASHISLPDDNFWIMSMGVQETHMKPPVVLTPLAPWSSATKHPDFSCSQSWTYQMVMQKKSWGVFVDFGIYLLAPFPTLFSSHAVWHIKKCLQKTWSTRFDWGLEHAYQEGRNCKPDFQDGGLCTSAFCGVFVAPKDVWLEWTNCYLV